MAPSAVPIGILVGGEQDPVLVVKEFGKPFNMEIIPTSWINDIPDVRAKPALSRHDTVGTHQVDREQHRNRRG